MQESKKHLQSGQVGVVTLLIMAVVLTIAISLSQRTTQQQDAAFIQDESTRVFNAAESGVEQALYEITEAELEGDSTDDIAGDFELDNNDQVHYRGQSQNQFEMFVATGDTVELPIDNPGSNSLDIFWWEGESGCGNDPSAIIVSVFDSTNNAKHFGFDPCGSDTERNTGFDPPSSESGDYAFSASVDLDANDRLVRIKPIFSSTKFQISSNAITLAQYNVESTGRNPQEDIARTLEVRRSLPSAHSFMDYSVVSGSSLSKDE